MRILFLAHRLPYPPNKGDKIRSFRELEALSQRHEVDLFCFYDQPEDRHYFPDVRRYCREFYVEKVSWPGSRARALLAFVLGRPFTTAFFHSPGMARRVADALHSRNYDLIFVFSSSMAPYVESASHIPRVLDMVDVDSNKWTQYADHTRSPISWLWRVEGRRLAEHEKRWARRFSVTLLCTPAETKILKSIVPDAKIEALHNQMDTSYFDSTTIEAPPEIAAWQPYIIFTGSMDYFPNVDAVTFFYREVFPLIRGALPQARFVIAGRNPTRAVRRLRRDPAVWVTGTVSDVRPYLRGASAAVAPLRIARGVQTKILEAMAMGLAVAVSSRAAKALPECLLSKTRVEDDPRRLAAFLIEKLRGPTSYETDARRAVLEYFAGLCWEDRLEDALLQALSSRNQSSEEVSGIALEVSRARALRADIVPIGQRKT